MTSLQSSALSPEESLKHAIEQLNEHESWWMERSTFLESHGYRLRPRFRPGWTPSWQNTDQNPLNFEDARFHLIPDVMDATRLSDGQQVVLKLVRRDGNEVRIGMMLSSPEALKDPMNHCVPILDYFGDLSTPGPDFIVMPLLRNFDMPSFQTISEVFDFVHQTLEGLVYIHKRGVAHRDLSTANIMMDGSEMYPHGVHPDPLWNYLLPDQNAPARALKRSEVKRVTYYFIDFGISSYFSDPLVPRLVTGIDGRDQHVPELDLKKPYDPFRVDIFSLGNTYKNLFRKYRNLDFLVLLVKKMTKKDPQDRPTAVEALDLFHELTDRLDSTTSSKRLRPVDEPIVVHYIHELSSSWNAFLSVVRSGFAPRSAALVMIPVGLSALILLRGNWRLFSRLRDLFMGVRGMRN